MLSNKLRMWIVLPLLTLTGIPAHADNLLDIYELALKNDPVLKAAEATYKAGQEAKIQGRSQLLPRITATAGYGEDELEQRSQFSFFRKSSTSTPTASRKTFP